MIARVIVKMHKQRQIQDAIVREHSDLILYRLPFARQAKLLTLSLFSRVVFICMCGIMFYFNIDLIICTG